jgi:hypothetical protein
MRATEGKLLTRPSPTFVALLSLHCHLRIVQASVAQHKTCDESWLEARCAYLFFFFFKRQASKRSLVVVYVEEVVTCVLLFPTFASRTGLCYSAGHLVRLGGIDDADLMSTTSEGPAVNFHLPSRLTPS